MSKNKILSEFEAGDAELAGELLDLREKPSAALQSRVQSIPVNQSRIRPPRWVWTTVALIGLLGLLLGSPIARAAWEGVEQLFGQIQLLALDQLPEYGEVVTLEGETVSWEEAQSAVPFTLALPDYLPDGYEMVDSLQLLRPEGGEPVIRVIWRHPDSGLLELSVHALDPVSPTKTLVGPDSSQAVLVNGQDAVIIHGGWEADSRRWQTQIGATTLIWEYQGAQNNLLAYGDEKLTSEVLIQIAESID